MKDKYKRKLEAIFDEKHRKEKAIIEKAKAEGKWAPGLDTNKELFEDLDKETRVKFQELIDEIEEDRHGEIE